jgi:hypothetical protein
LLNYRPEGNGRENSKFSRRFTSFNEIVSSFLILKVRLIIFAAILSFPFNKKPLDQEGRANGQKAKVKIASRAGGARFIERAKPLSAMAPDCYGDRGVDCVDSFLLGSI